MVSKSDSSLLPNLILWKTADEIWARQVLVLASKNWLDERVNAVFGLNGKWEFEKLRGSSLNMDKIHIVTRVLPIDPSQQDAMSQAVAAGALDPTDPRVKRKMMELFHLPIELDSMYTDQKAQWREIEAMRGTMQQIQPMMIRDNDAVHIDACRTYLNSDDAQTNPQLAQLVLQHAQMHIINMLRQNQMMAAVQGGAGEAPGAQPQGQPGEEGGPNGKKPAGQGEAEKGAQAGKRGGQTPKNPVTRQQRAVKGQAAKPKRPQPSSGNQYNQRRQT